jgi:hypothetical protein
MNENRTKHTVLFPMTTSGFRAVCSTCGWCGPDRSLKGAAICDGTDHLVTMYGAKPIVIQREPLWSYYP